MSVRWKRKQNSLHSEFKNQNLVLKLKFRFKDILQWQVFNITPHRLRNLNPIVIKDRLHT